MFANHPFVSPRRARLLAGTCALLLLVAGLATAAPVQAAAPTPRAPAKAPAKAAAKLQIPSVRASSAPAPTGTRITTTIVVRNATTTRQPVNNAVAYLLGQDRTFGLGEIRVPTTAAGTSVTVTSKHAAHPDAPTGRYAVQVCLGPRRQGNCRTSTTDITIRPARLVATPTSLTFAATALGGTSATERVTLTNRGSSRTGVLTPSTTGTAFAIDSSTCRRSLAVGATCHVDLDFTPDTVGSATSTLRIEARLGATVAVPLSGTGEGAPALTIDPESVDYDDTLVGATSDPRVLTVTNNGNLTSGVPDVALATSDFDLTATTCTTALAPDDTCTVTVTFTPTTPGARTGQLDVSATPGATTTADLSGTGLAPAELALTPPSTAFGAEVVGNTTEPVTFTLANTGDVASGTPSVVLGGIDADQFTLVTNGCTAAVPADGTCTIDVAFAPTATGSASASLDVSATPGGTDTSPLTGTGETDPALAISEASHDFGYTDTPAEHTFTVTNTGTRTTGTPLVDLAGSSAFTITSDTCTAPLPGGATCTVGVTYAGSGTVQQGAQLTVTASPGGAVDALLRGSPLALDINPSDHDFGGVLVGSSSDPVSFTITNHRLTSVFINGETTIGSFPVGTSCLAVTIPAQGTCTFTVRFAPNTAGPQSGYVEYLANGDTVRTDLSGTGLAPAALSVDRSAIQFGAYAPATTGNQVLTVTNTGGQATAAEPTVAISGTDAAEFTVQDTTCSGPLAGGASCTFTLQFAPLTLADEKVAAASVDGPGSPTVSLAGISAPFGVTMVPVVHDFGTQTVGSGTIHVFKVVNTTESGQTINSVSSGTPYSLDIPGDFTCVLSISVIDPHSWCTISIDFRPTSAGFFSRTLTAGGDFTATATMNGTAVPARSTPGARAGSTEQPQPTSVSREHGKIVVRRE